jgi:hypothetical protein
MVAGHRDVLLAPLSQVLNDYAQLGQTRYRAWVQRRDLTDRLPHSFADLLDDIYRFADPALTDGVADRHWNHKTLTWT